jgi:hypothetical protein
LRHFTEVTAVEVETKPFCMAPSLYGEDVSRCWPGRHPLPNAAIGLGCEGTFHVLDAITENLVLAQRKKAVQVEVLDDGECMFIKSSAGGNLREGQILRLDFEEGPCKNANGTYLGQDSVDADGSVAPEDASLPGHRLRCTPHTYAGGVSNVTQADFYEFPVDIEKAASVEKIVASGLLTPQPGHYVYPGHSGFAIDVERYTGMAQVAAVDLPEDMVADSVSVSFWLRKQDAYVSPQEGP